MKEVLLSLCLSIGFAGPAIGQHSTYGISAGFGNGFIMKKRLSGGASYDLNTGMSFGFQYSRKMNKRLHLLTGISMFRNSVNVTPASYPNLDPAPWHFDLRLIYIPVFLKVDFSRCFFINGGLIGDIDITDDSFISNQSGIGAGLGIGAEISLPGKLSIQINPYLNFHGLIMTDKENYPERVTDIGLKLNLIIKR